MAIPIKWWETWGTDIPLQQNPEKWKVVTLQWRLFLDSNYFTEWSVIHFETISLPP